MLDRSLAAAFSLALVGCNGDASGGGGSPAVPHEATASTQASSGAHASSSSSSSSGGGGAPPVAIGNPCRGLAVPDDAHFVPAGMCARLVAQGVDGLRQISFASNGDIYGVTADGSVRRFHDADGDGSFAASEIVEIASTGGNGNNCHLDEEHGYLYAGSPVGVRRWKLALSASTLGDPEDVVIGQPGDGNHPKHTVHVYDGYLYVHSGSSDNASDPMSPAYDTGRALLRRFKLSSFAPGHPLSWTSGEVFSAGIRNMVGFTKNAAGRMFGVVNGLDNVRYNDVDVHEDNPGEQVLELGLGKRFGYPFCFTAQRVVAGDSVVPAGHQLFNQDFASGHDDAWCAANSTPPATFIQAHSAPLDIAFFDGDAPTGALPESLRGGAFVALHGSWDRTSTTGYKVVHIPVDASGDFAMPTSTADGTNFPYETVFGGGDASGPYDGGWMWSAGGVTDHPRPCGVAISPVDGALYVSSDSSGTLYRIGQHLN